MVERRLNRNLDPWRCLLSDFIGASEAQQLATVGEWRGLLSAFSGLRSALQTAVGQPSASRCTFNVFAVTRRSGFEVTTHSALLCDLLDPRGTHGQGGAFLDVFLALLDANLSRSMSRAPWPPADGWWSAAPEFPAPQAPGSGGPKGPRPPGANRTAVRSAALSARARQLTP